jgi:hypothetical protein
MAGEVLAHFGHLAIGATALFLSIRSECHRDGDEGMTTYLPYLSLGLFLLLAGLCSGVSLVIGLLILLEYIIFVNHYLRPYHRLADLFMQYYCSIIVSSLCSFISCHQNKRTSSRLTKIAILVFHLQLLILVPETELNWTALLLCCLLTAFLSAIGMTPSGIESPLFYWTIFLSSDWIIRELSSVPVPHESFPSLQLTNLIAASGLLSVLFLGQRTSSSVSLCL